MHQEIDNGEVTVKQALKKGRGQLLWGPLVLLFSIMVLWMIGVQLFPDDTKGGVLVVILVSLILTILIIPLACYEYMLPRWRIWAFSHVRNVHELRQKALLAAILPPEGSIWSRMEIKTAEQKRILMALEERFTLPDIFIDDPYVPFETAIHYPKSDRIIFIGMSVSFLVASVYFITDGDVGVGVFMLLPTLLLGYMAYKRMISTGPIATLSNEGITLSNETLHPWQHIKNERTYREGMGEHSSFGLTYELYERKVNISLPGKATTTRADDLLRIYRGRYESRNTNTRK